MTSNTLKGVLCICAGCMVHFIGGSISSWGANGNYLISYLRYYDQSIEQIHAYFIFPLGTLCNAVLLSLEFIHSRLNMRLSVGIGTSIMTTSFFLFSMTRNIYLIYLLMATFGTGLGFAVNLFTVVLPSD